MWSCKCMWKAIASPEAITRSADPHQRPMRQLQFLWRCSDIRPSGPEHERACGMLVPSHPITLH